MQIFTIYQNHAVKNNYHLVNKLGWGKAAEQVEGVAEHLKTFGSYDSDVDAAAFKYHLPVATVVMDYVARSPRIEGQLEDVFATSNCSGNNGNGYINFAKAHSLSVGDLVRTPDGDFWVVAGAGFELRKDIIK